MSAEDILAPVPKLDPETLVRWVEEHVGVRLTVVGPCPGGEVGAAYVRWPDGRESVMTQFDTDLKHAQRTGEILRIARERGVPAPRYELVAEVPGTLVIVQELLPGRPAGFTVSRGLVGNMVELNERFRGLLADRRDMSAPSLYLRESGPGFCIHESLARYSDRTRRLLDWVHSVGADTEIDMVGDDLVHLDFHPGNVLVDGSGAITGIIDWDGIARGDHRFALVTLKWAITDNRDWPGPHAPFRTDPDTAAWLSELVDDVLDPGTFRRYWAHMSLRMVDWAIRHWRGIDVEWWLDVAESRADLS